MPRKPQRHQHLTYAKQQSQPRDHDDQHGPTARRNRDCRYPYRAHRPRRSLVEAAIAFNAEGVQTLRDRRRDSHSSTRTLNAEGVQTLRPVQDLVPVVVAKPCNAAGVQTLPRELRDRVPFLTGQAPRHSAPKAYRHGRILRTAFAM